MRWSVFLLSLSVAWAGCRGASAPTLDSGRAVDAGPDARAEADAGGPDASADASADADAGPATCAAGHASKAMPPATGVTVVVEATQDKFSLSPVLQGANINQWWNGANGLWDAQADAPNADAVKRAARAGLGLLRFPGGTSANLYDWKRAVGPRAARGCQIDAKALVGRNERDYGPSEFIRLVRAVGAAPQILVPFANESPKDAADWVEYMNAPVGTNPGGGIAWADVRAADGSPAPFDVTRWEIGNEHDRGGHQAYWMTKSSGPSPSDADRQRLDQYIDGAELSFVDQPMGRSCDFDKTRTTSAGGQTFHLRYGLIKSGTFPRVKVGGVEWARVGDLSTAGPSDEVYTLDRSSGSVTFGDGTHGAIPPAGEQVTASYSFKHQGFVAIYEAMKARAAAIGTPISVCASWAPPAARGTPLKDLGAPSFAQAMKSRGLADRYDCVAIHPYTNFGRDFGSAWTSPEQGHHQHMLGDGWSRALVADLRADLKTHATAGAFVTISEMGALWFTSGDEGAALPEYSATMTHALFMASQWIHYARMNLGWVEGNTLVASAKGLRGVLGGSATGFVYGAEALTREALKPFFADGSTWVGSRVERQAQVSAPGGESWPALGVGASSAADGALRIAVINRRISKAQSARVAPAGFVHGAAVAVTTVRGASFSSYNDGVAGGGDDSVEITQTTKKVATADFDHSFPPASVTVLTLRPPCP